MPLPAGTGLSRRSFLARSSGLALAVFGGAALAPRALDAGIAAAGPTSPVLVSIFLSGGFDSLSMLAPVGDSRYAQLRPTLKLAPNGDAFSEDNRLQWHPNAAPLRDLHLAGKVSVMPAIGYDDANQSHFTSRHYWEVGELNPFGRIGWLGRYLDKHGADDNPLQGLSLDWSLAPALAASNVPVAACAASSRACPSPPAPASPAAPSSHAAAGSRCRCSAARCCRGWRSRRASRAPRRGRPSRC